MLGAPHLDGAALDEGGADGVGAGQALAPGHPGAKRHLGGPAGEAVVAQRIEDQPVGIGQDHQPAGRPGIGVQGLDLRPAALAQSLVAVEGGAHLGGAQGLDPGARPEIEAEGGAALPGAQDRRRRLRTPGPEGLPPGGQQGAGGAHAALHARPLRFVGRRTRCRCLRQVSQGVARPVQDGGGEARVDFGRKAHAAEEKCFLFQEIAQMSRAPGRPCPRPGTRPAMTISPHLVTGVTGRKA